MEKILKEMKTLLDEFEKEVKEKTGYTIGEINKLDDKKFEKVVKQVFNEIEKENIKEKEDGNYLKIYEIVHSKNGEGVAVEGKGSLTDILSLCSKAMANIIKENKDCITCDTDEFVDMLCDAMKKEIKGGN